MRNFCIKDSFSIWIVTYNRKNELNNTIRSLQKTMPSDIKINIISNHSSLELFEDYKNVKVYENNLRPDDSWGYLARNWNQCYYLGLDKTEYVMCIQDDNDIVDGWFELINKHNSFEFYLAPVGDVSHIASRSSFLKVGWWDERFICMDFHDYDYINRIHNTIKDTSSVVDRGLDVSWNSIGLENFLHGGGYKFDEDVFDRPRGHGWIHTRMNRIYYGKKRGKDFSDNVRCQKDSAWRDINLKTVIDEVDWYPWFTSKMQKLTGKNQEFMKIPFESHYDHTGY